MNTSSLFVFIGLIATTASIVMRAVSIRDNRVKKIPGEDCEDYCRITHRQFTYGSRIFEGIGLLGMPLGISIMLYPAVDHPYAFFIEGLLLACISSATTLRLERAMMAYEWMIYEKAVPLLLL